MGGEIYMKSIKTAPHTPSSITIEDLGGNKTRICAYPFETGYAITIAHPLKRLLLGSSVGYAPIAVKIEGIEHEFDSLRGMMEDVTLFIAHLKTIRFKMKNEEAQKVSVDYHFKGHNILKGSDLTNDLVEVVTPEQYLATINENADFNFSVIIEKGIGYVASEDIRSIVPNGFIPLDAYFTPVRRVVYEIENMLYEDDPTFEKIVFEIETDGQIQPMDAFNNALDVMQKQFSVFGGTWTIKGEQLDNSEEEVELKSLLQKIEVLGLSARSFNCLDKANIKYVGEIVLMSETDLKEVKNLGKKSTDEIKEKMEEIGFPFGGNISPEIISSLQKKLNKLK